MILNLVFRTQKSYPEHMVFRLGQFLLVFFWVTSSLAFSSPIDVLGIPKIDWELTTDEKRIQMFKATIPGSDIIAFRGLSWIDADIEQVAGVLLDPARASEWVKDLESSRILQWTRKPYQYVEYNHVGTPFFLKDRDFVSTVTIIPRSDQELLILYSDPPEGSAPETSHVRGDLTGSGFKLTSRGGRTLFDGWVICDPKGALPKWIVNWAQSSWPRDTIEGLRKQVEKPGIQTFRFRVPEHQIGLYKPDLQ